MTGASIPAGASAWRTDCTMRPVTTITAMPASCARRIASIVRGRRRESVQTSVRSKSVATTWTSRGKSSGSLSSAVRVAAGRLDDVGGDVRDLGVAQLALERGHRALAVEHPGDDERERRLRLVEIRPDLAGGAGVRERVAPGARPRLEDRLARCGVAVLVLRLDRRRRRRV